MISLQAKVVRSLLKISSGKNSYNPSRIKDHRRDFERNVSLLFPSWHSKFTRTQIAGVNVGWILPSNAIDRTIIYLHGGGFVLGSLKTHQQHMQRLARMCGAKILAIDYSLSPEHPYPTALEEIQRIWEELIKSSDFDASRVVFAGDSAGGGLVLGSALRFKDAGLPQPACLVLLSPALDATFSGPSYNQKGDAMLNSRKLEFFARAYAQHHSRKIPYISPVYADLKDLPPFLIHVGSEEMLLSDSETVAKHAVRDGVEASLYVGEGMWHGWHLFASYVPEAREAMKAIAEYVISHTKA